MFVWSFKAQNLKFALSLALSAAAVALVVAFAPKSADKISAKETDTLSAVDAAETKFENVTDNDARIEFLKSYGWQVEPNAREVSQISLPEEFDVVYQSYNELQKAQGLDLSRYRGKSVERYSYLVSNYEYDGEVMADLLIYKGEVIGGDLRSAVWNGFVHGFEKENALPNGSLPSWGE